MIDTLIEALAPRVGLREVCPPRLPNGGAPLGATTRCYHHLAKEWGVILLDPYLATWGTDEEYAGDALYQLEYDPVTCLTTIIMTNHYPRIDLPAPGWLWRDLAAATDGAWLQFALLGQDHQLISDLRDAGILTPHPETAYR